MDLPYGWQEPCRLYLNTPLHLTVPFFYQSQPELVEHHKAQMIKRWFIKSDMWLIHHIPSTWQNIQPTKTQNMLFSVCMLIYKTHEEHLGCCSRHLCVCLTKMSDDLQTEKTVKETKRYTDWECNKDRDTPRKAQRCRREETVNVDHCPYGADIQSSVLTNWQSMLSSRAEMSPTLSSQYQH